MGKVGILVAAVALLAACTRSSYVYVALSDDNVEVTHSGEPPLRKPRFGGDPIPIRYALKEPGLSLTLAVADEAFVPSFDITSSVPIREVSVGTTGSAIRKSQVEYKVFWSSARVGQSVQIRIDLENRTDPIRISGVIAESGTVYDLDSL